MQNHNNSTTGKKRLDEKSVAIISYLTIIGWAIAFVMNSNNKNQFAIYHIRQALFIMLAGFAFYILQTILLFIPYIGLLINLLTIPIGLFLLVLWIKGLIYAINGEEKPIPFIGLRAQKIFKRIK